MFLNEIGYTIALPSDKFDLEELTQPGSPPQNSLGKARVTHASQYFDSNTKVTVERSHDFLGLVFNLGQDFGYAFPGMDVPPGKFRRNHFMFVYLPRATMSYALKRGTVTTFACQVPVPYVRTWQNAFPVLREFLDKAEKGVAATLMSKPGKISKDVLQAIDQTLNNTFDPFFRDVYFCIKITDLVDGCLRQLSSVKKVPGPSFASRPAVEKARMYILQHLQDNLSVDQIAEAVGLEPRTLARNFKKLYRLTVMSFLFEERMKKAVVLLRTSDHPISKIAELVGYRSISNFTDAFVRKFGYAPSTLRTRKKP